MSAILRNSTLAGMTGVLALGVMGAMVTPAHAMGTGETAKFRVKCFDEAVAQYRSGKTEAVDLQDFNLVQISECRHGIIDGEAIGMPDDVPTVKPATGPVTAERPEWVSHR